MPALRSSYTLFPREWKGGKVYYYQTYSPDGKRTTPKSTGQKSKSAARVFCDDLLKKGLLYSSTSRVFGEYAKGFFDESSIWLKDRMSVGTADRPALSKAYINYLQMALRVYLIPYFATVKMTSITPSKIKEFRMHLKENLSNKSVNLICGVLKAITDTALSDGVIVLDPFRGIKKLNTSDSRRDAFTMEEVKIILHSKFTSENHRLCALVAAFTGMRISEILAIRKETLSNQFIDVRDQLSFDGKEFVPVKTKDARMIPIPEYIYELLKDEIDKTGGRAFPFRANAYRLPLAPIISSFADAKARKLSFHSFRHFCNTYLLSENVAPPKVAAVIGLPVVKNLTPCK